MVGPSRRNVFGPRDHVNGTRIFANILRVLVFFTFRSLARSVRDGRNIHIYQLFVNGRDTRTDVDL